MQALARTARGLWPAAAALGRYFGQVQPARGIMVQVRDGNLEQALSVTERKMRSSGMERLIRRRTDHHVKNSEKRVLARKALMQRVGSQELGKKLRGILIKKISAPSYSFHNDLRTFGDSIGAPSRSLSNQSGGDGGGECWSCGARGAFLSCGSCRSVQPVDPTVDYFRIFGLERQYGIRDNNLEGKYKDWQKKLHPDLVHSKSEKERAFAAEQSALVIDAYHTLRKPLSRAQYLLQLEGIHVDEEKTINDPELLMEMMEIREAVNEASDSKTLEKIQSQIKGKHETWSNSFQEAFDKGDFDRAVEATQRMRYYDRAVEETVKKL